MSRKHKYSQHFLRSPRLVAELIGHSNLRKNDLVYDLGAGSGVITSALARRVREVVAVEIEPVALTKLKSNMSDSQNVTILEQDILNLREPSENYKIFSNIPFSISAAVVRKFTRAKNPPRSTYLIVQKQFARKLVPGKDHFTGQLSAEISPWFSARIRKTLRKTDFTPPPAVDTVLLEIKPLEKPLLPPSEKAAYLTFTKNCFERQVFFAKLKKPFSPELRPSQLTPAQWIELYRLNKKHPA